MRLWTVHPKYLDSKGLVAAWREALLAQKVLAGGTRGYRSHPQLLRFKAHRDPLGAIGCFLAAIERNTARQGYRFDRSLILRGRTRRRMNETRGQLRYEWEHLKGKLGTRAPDLARAARGVAEPGAHPLFRIVPGTVRTWEKR